MSTANGPLSDQTIRALRLYQSQKYTEVRAFAENELYQHSENFGLRFVSGLAACRLGDPDIGVSEIKKARAIFPQISDYYCMEAVNWQRGIVNFVDHMEANFFQYVETCVTENFLISYPKCGRTWVRIVLGKYLLGASSGNPLELDGLTASRADCPNTLVTHDDFPH